jgi:ribosomal-protein-alanine acetyltransferase
MSSAAEVRVRRMSAADLEHVLKIAESLPEAPQWAASAYVAAMDSEFWPRRITLVAEFKGADEEAAEGLEAGGERTAGAKARSISLAVLARLKSCPVTERVAGFAMASLISPEAELETIAVGLEAQRCGVASLLLRAITQELRAERVSSLRLEVRSSNQAALGFYRAHGFEQTGLRRRYYADPEEDAILFELKFG